MENHLSLPSGTEHHEGISSMKNELDTEGYKLIASAYIFLVSLFEYKGALEIL